MLKKTAVAIPLLICVLLGAEEIVPPLKNMDFSSGLTHWRSASAIDDGTFAVIRETMSMSCKYLADQEKYLNLSRPFMFLRKNY